MQQRTIVFFIYTAAIRPTPSHCFQHFVRCLLRNRNTYQSRNRAQIASHSFYPYTLFHTFQICAGILRSNLQILFLVMKMKTNKDILSSLLKTAQMGQVGIRSVMDTSMSSGMRQALKSQLQEYDTIETEAHTLASQRGWELRELDPAVRSMSNMMTRMKLIGSERESKIADMMIQGNTRGMIKSLKNIHHAQQQDDRISALSQKLLDTETANIRQMKEYL